MPSAKDALLRYEAGQTSVAISALTDSGNHIAFTGSASPWSRRDGYAPVIRPNGLLTGGVVTPAASGVADKVDVSAGTAYISGALVSFNASTDLALDRAVTTDTHIISSIVVASNGTVSEIAGVDHTAFSETRAADGGPPLIPATSVELAQVRFASLSSAAVDESEIFAVVGVHTERSDYPVWDVDYYLGKVTFVDDLPLIHTDTKPKGVFASYAAPIYADVSIAADFVPPEDSYSVSSTQVYGRTIGASSSSLGQGTFTAYLNDGVTDSLIGLGGQTLWFKFYPNRYTAPYVTCQGILGITRAYPAGDNITASCTINAESAARNVAA
jgi:hypothetical protein